MALVIFRFTFALCTGNHFQYYTSDTTCSALFQSPYVHLVQQNELLHYAIEQVDLNFVATHFSKKRGYKIVVLLIGFSKR